MGLELVTGGSAPRTGEIVLQRGDRLPTVGVLQLLLIRTGAELTPDGVFGRHTEAAVRAFQGDRHMPANGRVDHATWQRISAGEDLPIVDSVDITDPDLLETEVSDLRRAGARVVLRGGMCNGVAQAVQDIRTAAARPLFLLRLHGHGAPGTLAISSGHSILPGERAAIDLSTLRNVEPDLRRLRGIFGPYGSVNLMGCNVGQGTSGHALLLRLANLWDVPVTAGVRTQYAGGTRTVRFEGPTVTRCPGNRSLAHWVRSRPPFAPFTPV